MHVNLDAEYHTVDDVLVGLSNIEQHFLAQRDRRGVFATAYLHISQELNRRLAAQWFVDNAWVRQYLVCFANLYRRAVLAYEFGEHAAIPKAWKIAFDAARDRIGLVIQHLMLGINAHINHDLALALVEVGIDPNRSARYHDHTAVNQALEESTASLKHRVSSTYAPVLQRLDRIAGNLDEKLMNFSIPKAREHAWTFAVALTDVQDDEVHARLRRTLDEQAAVLARLVLNSPSRDRLLVNTVRFVERIDALAWRVQGRRLKD